MKQNLGQLIKFCTIGGINTFLTYLIYLLLYQSTGNTFAMASGYGITSLLGLLFNDHWVFKADSPNFWLVLRFYATYGLTWLLSVGLTFVASNWWNFQAELIPLFCLLITTPTNFLLSKFWVFKKSSKTIQA
ncbi:MAG TPA: GtrA family protein [Ligilactobacillus acidipiscis]|uniref:GtrA family protein n=1 Tax=Ligilactobacillus acidipiscis TaxID=89059 RepID=A0A921F9X0_9LACO|nr:GtrA family protein [Ligilactobacillus acidipiscis]